MSSVEKLDLYRRMFASSVDDEEVVWWYFGTTFLRLPGRPEIPVLQAETIMVYRTQTLDENSFRIHWREVGYFRDPITGAPAKSWRNPLTGREVQTPSRFEEGPSHYTISRTGDSLAVVLEQAHAIVERIDTRIEEDGPHLTIVQTERKRRGFPLPDNTIPSQNSKNVTTAQTVLTFFAQAGDAQDGASNIRCSGIYSFSLDKVPGWMGIEGQPGDVIVKGMIHKSTPTEQVNPLAWRELRTFFPAFFDRDRVAPGWS